MSNFRDFDKMLSEKVGGRPTFVMGGEKFECRAKLPWKKFSSLILALSTGTTEEGKTSLEQTEDFFRLVLVRADRQRFIDLLNRDGEPEDEDSEDDEEDEHIAANEQVGELLDWLLGHYTGKKAEDAEDEDVIDGQVVEPKVAVSKRPVKTASLNSKASV